jgi:hypothetical protein
MNRSELETLGDRIAEHAAHLDAATHRLLTDIRQFDTECGWYSQGARTCAQWLSWRLGWDPGTAREHVRVAHRLSELPLIDDSLRRGETSYCKVRAMTRVATPANEEMLLEESRYTTGAQLERICRKYASIQRHDDGHGPKDDMLRRYLSRRDTADGMVDITARLHPEEAAIVWAALERVAVERCMARDLATAYAEERSKSVSAETSAGASVSRKHDGLADGDVEGESEPARQGEPARKSEAARESEPPRRRRQHSQPTQFDRADALVALAEETIRGTRKDRSPIELAITVTPETLRAPASPAASASTTSATRSAPGPGCADPNVADRHVRGVCKDLTPVGTAVRPETSLASWARSLLPDSDSATPMQPDPCDVGCFTDGTCVTSHAARRLACDCGVVEVATDNQGIQLSVGRRRRTIPGPMKKALIRRDVTCRFPGCCARVFLEGHHIEHWIDGGETKLVNMLSLCTWHHRFVHEYGFSTSIKSNGELVFRDDRGRLVESIPQPARPANLGWPSILTANETLQITNETLACGWDGMPVDYYLATDALVRSEHGVN